MRTDQSESYIKSLEAHSDGTQPRSHTAVRKVARFVNRFVLPLSGTRLLPLYGVMEHYGRRSGKAYRTPVVVRPTGEGFIVPMPWGEGTDWYRNVRAAGECVIRWKGRNYPMVQPELITPAAAQANFSALERAMITRFGINQFLHLRHASAAAPSESNADSHYRPPQPPHC